MLSSSSSAIPIITSPIIQATANITADILCRLSESIPKNLRKGGTLILSGIIESKLAQVKDAYAAVGLTLREQLRKGEWFALAFQS